jgi:hypothetical protein
MPKLNEARSGAPSRRGLIQGATACALPLPLPVGGTDPALVVARQWCGLEIEQRRLILAWQARESWLFEHHNWPRLSDAEQRAVPEGALLREIDERLHAIDKVYDALLPRLKTTSATTREGLFARFEALLHFVVQDEHPDARAILKSCLVDLKRLWA